MEHLLTARERGRFASKVIPEPMSGCHLWLGSMARGYGYFHIKRKERARRQRVLRAHRVAWAIEHGPIPAGLVVMHRCDNPPCVNPRHLQLGSIADNVADMARKGRVSRGTSHPCARLNDEKVREIRAASASGESTAAIARRYGLSKMTAKAVLRRRTWKHVAAAETK